MDWTTLLTAIVSSGVIIGVIEMIRDWRTKKSAAETANKENEYEAQMKGLDLVQEFYNKVTDILNANGKDVVDRLEKIESRIGDIERYLNGGLKEYKQNKTQRK